MSELLVNTIKKADGTGLQEKLHELFEYRDGKLFWKVDRRAVKCKGKEAGTIHNGYRNLHSNSIGGHMSAHRAIWVMHHGDLPEVIDHINGDKLDNRIENLRAATRSQNVHNIAMLPSNQSGVKNVSWRNDTKKWRVTLAVDGKKMSFGHYDDLELAELVAHEARCKYHGEFANHGVSNV